MRVNGLLLKKKIVDIFPGLWLRVQNVEGELVILTEGPSAKHPDRNNRLEIIDLGLGQK